MNAITELATTMSVAKSCRIVGVDRPWFIRRRAKTRNVNNNTASDAAHVRPTPPRALDADERVQVLATLGSEHFVDCSPKQVYAELLDEGRYLCSERSMYRILKHNDAVRERRNHRRHPNYAAPELLATSPNQVWSWDITKIKGPVRGTWYHLYVIIDIYSRAIVGWMIANREHDELAAQLIKETCQRQGIAPGTLTIHADRGSSMRSKRVAELLCSLEVLKSLSRPYFSNDNPYSESHFKTMKYRPDFPERFGSIEDARRYFHEFFLWYNTVHRHSGIAMLTPDTVHHHRAKEIVARRDLVLRKAYAIHPERFVRRIPTAPRLPAAV